MRIRTTTPHHNFLPYGIVFLVAVSLLSGCGGGGRRSGESTITIKGSDTMILLGQRWAEAFMGSHPGLTVQVTGGGSGTGIAALIGGTTEICQASRPMKDDEKEQMRTRYGEPPHETVVAKDGVTVYLNESNSVTKLTLAQLRDIYTGKITDWKDLGGPQAAIVLYGRENSSGTYEFLKDHVLAGADFAAATQTLPGTAAVVNAVARDAAGIGYGGAAYVKGVRECALAKDDGSEAVLPTEANVKSGAYPLSRDLYFYTRKAPEGAEKQFVDFALSDEGQKLVKEVGYYPLR